MPTRILTAACGLVLAPILGGCYSLPVTHAITGSLETIATPMERISLTVRSFLITKGPGAGKPAESMPAPESAKTELRRCLIDELQAPRSDLPALVVEPLESGAASAAQDGKTVEAKGPGAVPATVSGTPSAARYSVVVDSKRTTEEAQISFLPLLLIMVYQSSALEALEHKASIYDQERGSLAGTVVATSGGKTGTSAGYIGYYGGFERRYLDVAGVCRELSTGIRNFFAGRK